MKLLILSACTLLSLGAFAQQKNIDKAIIYTTTNVVAPEEEDVAQIGNQGGGGMMRMQNMMDGETKSTTYIRGGLTKTAYKSEIGRGTVYRDNDKKTTSTVIEAMGNKFGIAATDDDQAELRRRQDSMMKARAEADTTMRRRMRTQEFAVNIAYTDESKKIAGYNVKKAWVITDRILAKDSLAVWYTPEIKFAHLTSTGGLAGLGNMAGATGFEKIDGFVMEYSRKMPRGRVMEVKVTKIELDKDIADKEFELPKDVEFRSAREMGGAEGGMRMMMRQ